MPGAEKNNSNEKSSPFYCRIPLLPKESSHALSLYTFLSPDMRCSHPKHKGNLNTCRLAPIVRWGSQSHLTHPNTRKRSTASFLRRERLASSHRSMLLLYSKTARTHTHRDEINSTLTSSSSIRRRWFTYTHRDALNTYIREVIDTIQTSLPFVEDAMVTKTASPTPTPSRDTTPVYV